MKQTIASLPPVHSLASLDLPAQTGSLNGRAVVKQNGSLWNKVCQVIRQFVEWIKRVFSSESIPIKPKKLLPPIELAPADLSFLRKNDPAYNLQRIAGIRFDNAAHSLCTEEVFKTLPQTNPIRLGYKDPVQYQTALGDRFVAGHIGLTALAGLALSLGGVSSCGLLQKQNKFSHCVKAQEQFLNNTNIKTLLAGGALALGASLYAHHQGWLGSLLHDRSLGRRTQEIEQTFRDAALQLEELQAADPSAAKELMQKIMNNHDLILATLQVELQMSAEQAAAALKPLHDVCLTSIGQELIAATLNPTPKEAAT